MYEEISKEIDLFSFDLTTVFYDLWLIVYNLVPHSFIVFIYMPKGKIVSHDISNISSI